MATTTRRRLARGSALTLLAAWSAVGAGCCHHPCYAPMQSGCPPLAAQPATVRYGEVCEAPPEAGASIVARAPSKAVPMTSAPRPRIVVSEPSGRLAGRPGWRRPDPERIATHVEGTLDDDTINR